MEKRKKEFEDPFKIMFAQNTNSFNISWMYNIYTYLPRTIKRGISPQFPASVQHPTKSTSFKVARVST